MLLYVVKYGPGPLDPPIQDQCQWGKLSVGVLILRGDSLGALVGVGCMTAGGAAGETSTWITHRSASSLPGGCGALSPERTSLRWPS